ncbi:MAG: SGNH/GDSL hydrolase family protein [Phycisphaerales bacterium]
MNEKIRKNASRRDFMKSITATIGGTMLMLSSGNSSVVAGCKTKSLIQQGNTILFQGDSVTDANRYRENESKINDRKAFGNGYAYSIASQLLSDKPGDELKFYNRGISGNKVFQLSERWDKDCLEIKPDVLSILIGVNDIWHVLEGRYDGTVERYEKDYRLLLQRTVKALPNVKLIICEPFVLRCGAVDDKWFPEFDSYRAVAKKLSNEFEAAFVPFQSMFDKALKKAPPAYWAEDGLHPSMAGAYMMAQEWLEIVGGIL